MPTAKEDINLKRFFSELKGARKSLALKEEIQSGKSSYVCRENSMDKGLFQRDWSPMILGRSEEVGFT